MLFFSLDGRELAKKRVSEATVSVGIQKSSRAPREDKEPVLEFLNNL
jgi:hypothetical protein